MTAAFDDAARGEQRDQEPERRVGAMRCARWSHGIARIADGSGREDEKRCPDQPSRRRLSFSQNVYRAACPANLTRRREVGLSCYEFHSASAPGTQAAAARMREISCAAHRSAQEESARGVAVEPPQLFQLERRSTPSALTPMPRVWARPMTASMIAVDSSLVPSPDDERPVDLQDVDPESQQIEQRRVSGAEVVDRDAHAERLDVAQLGAAASPPRRSACSRSARGRARSVRARSACSDGFDDRGKCGRASWRPDTLTHAVGTRRSCRALATRRPARTPRRAPTRRSGR